MHVIETTRDGSVFVNTPRLRTFGANISSISNFIFEDGAISRVVAEIEARLKNSPDLENVEWRAELENDLSTEATMYLKGRLPKSSGI